MHLSLNILLPAIFRGACNKLSHNLGDFLTTAGASLSLVGTLIYIFVDFFRTELPQISPTLASNIFTGILLGCLILVSINFVRAMWDKTKYPHSLPAFLAQQGASPRHLQLGIFAEQLTNWLLGPLAIGGILLFFFPSTVLHRSVGAALTLTLVFLLWRTLNGHRFVSSTTFSQRHSFFSSGANHTTFLWRLHMLWQEPTCMLLLSGGFIMVVLTPWLLPTDQATSLATSVATSLSSLIGLASLTRLLHLDLLTIEFQRQLGLDGEHFISAYENIGWLIGLVFGLAATGSYLTWAAVAASHPAPVLIASQLFCLAAFPWLLFAPLMLQIDGRKPILVFSTILGAAILGMTAIVAWLPSFLLTPIVSRFVNRYQIEKFFRA